MTNQTAKVRNGTVALPEKLRKSWKGARVYIRGEKDTIFIRRLQPPSLPEMLDEFKKVGKGISRKEVGEAIRSVRRGRKY